MKDVAELHEEAMELVDRMLLARLRGDAEAVVWARQAFERERQVADLIEQRFDLEPTRSVLHRSAAALAIDCGEIEEARRLIEAGLAGYPPAGIEKELQGLLRSGSKG
ncbi:hypothetical protein [Synechococcus sp. PCC 7336]|uniref:hypothetical protein n=1 Tax=Synechococcus sp. PCC 7336 TaxID=195250 RepID=UPI0003451D81|nr:hypothetical protein [Synechococcus sp. PCC 7336]